MQETKEIEAAKEHQGFFVKVRDDCFQGPFSHLKEARDEAQKLGSGMEIYHGILKFINDQIIDTSRLFLVPKMKK